MTMDDILEHLLSASIDAVPCPGVVEWWPHYAAAAARWPHPFDLALAGGFAADRTGWAFACGYQAALRALLPELPDDRICAFCVTEPGGNTPRAVATALSRKGAAWSLSGAKRWTTLGPSGALFVVIARDEEASRDRPVLRAVRVPSDAAGVRVESMPETRFVPEVPHAQLRFEDVAVPNDALLGGDAYDLYVKPFRTVEDLHVNAAVMAYLLREARRLGWPRAWIERTLAHLEALRALAARDPSSSATHLALAGALGNAALLLKEADQHWPGSADDVAASRWARDRDLLATASKVREARTQRAWERAAAS